MRVHEHYVLVRPLEAEDELSAGGIVLPDQALKLKRGRALCVGSDVGFVEEGDTVLYNPLGVIEHGDDFFIQKDSILGSLPDESD